MVPSISVPGRPPRTRPGSIGGSARRQSRMTLPLRSLRASWWWSGWRISHTTLPCQSTSSAAPALNRSHAAKRFTPSSTLPE